MFKVLKLHKLFAFLLFVLFFDTPLIAQLSRTHYIPPITTAQNSNALPQNQYLHISSPSTEAINVEVTQIGTGSTSYSLSNTAPLEIFIGSGETTPFVVSSSNTATKITNKGYIIQSEKPVYVSVRLTGGNQNQAGSLVSKGLSGLGQTFRAGTFTNLKNFSSSNQDYLNFISIMATENNTQVNFTDIPADVVIENGTPLTTNLNVGESYIIALDPSITPSNRDGLIGALISSTKPIVVNCGSFNGSNSDGNGRDAGIDQIAPLETIAVDDQTFSEYVFVRANGYDAIERPLIVAHYDNTEVWTSGDSGSGVFQGSINAGEYLSLDGSLFSTQSSNGSNPGGNLYVWTSKTTFAYQGIGGTNNDANQELFFVPPLNCKAPRAIDNIPLIESSGSTGANFNGGITIVAEAGADVNINGAPTTAPPQVILGNSNFVTYLISGLSGNVSVTSDGQIYVSYYGASGAAALGGFYSGFIFKPEITSTALDVTVDNICIPFIELNLGSEETFDAYQWFFNGAPIVGATSETHIPTTPGYYQLEGTITDCSSVLSDNIPVSGCAGDSDDDGQNNNFDVDIDNDGILNTEESNCNFDFDLSSDVGLYFTASTTTSSENITSDPFEGFTNQIMHLSASPKVGNIQSTTTYQLVFDAPTHFKIEQAPATFTTGAMNDEEDYKLSVPADQTITVLNPDNQLLIDINYDGIYDNNVQEFTAFEIRFKLNSAALPTGNGTFSFQSYSASQFEIEYNNISEINSNSVAFQLTQACRSIDSDGDNIEDAVDLDSDNDGIFDVVESGNSALDTNGNGRVDGMNTNDSDSDGHHDLAQSPIDTDLDSIPDYLDLDSDNDGLFDLFEAGIGFNTLDMDNNGQIDLGFTDDNFNGSSDVAESIIPLDSDADGLPDFIELDSDADDCFDVDEAGFTGTLGVLSGTSIDTNGLVLGGDGYGLAIDTNADGLFDYQDFINITTQSLNTPLFVCEEGNTTIEIILESNSDDYDNIFWEWSFDGGLTWTFVPETPSSFENVSTNTLEIFNVSDTYTNTFFRAQMQRTDLVCKSYYSDEVQLIVNPLPVIVEDVSLFQCDQDTDGITIFNLNEANELISVDYLNETFSFYFDESEALLGTPNSIADPVNYQNTNSDPTINPNQIFVRVETINGCSRVAQLDLFVSTTQIPTGFSIPPYQECFDDSDGSTTFDFSDSKATILGIFPPTQPLTVAYYESELDALSEINPILDIQNYENTSGVDQFIWVRVDSDIDNSCVGLGQYIDLIVNPIPVLNTPVDPYFCVGPPNSFNLNLANEYDAFVLDGQSAADFTVSYFISLTDAESSTSEIFTVTNSASFVQIVYKITNNTTGCYDIDTFEIDFIEIPAANQPADFSECDNNNDGIYLFDTSTLEAQILGGQTTMNIAYYDGLGNPLEDENGQIITSPFPDEFLSSSQTITAIVFNGICTDASIDISFLVNPNTNFSVDDIVICDGSSQLIQLNMEDSSSSFKYTWTLPDSTVVNTLQPELDVAQIGVYNISVTNLNGSCFFSQPFEVFESEGPSISMDNITIVEGTSNNSITIDEAALGSANYEFKLIDENGNLVSGYQDIGYFGQLTGGFYSLYVRDELRCEEVVITVPVLYIMNFFTPNGDGFNDTWKIKGIRSNNYNFSKISVFDRYGKLLKNMTINSNFWDGTYNGVLMPTNDYWYSIELTKIDGTHFVRQGHFTLRR
ncbi:T9SS type B sorting domain-containing protein [Flavobacteriaceae bacterium]|jgi:gliding motility-associated-like protein|nr:T9SS type B sorting domain-containing protein [Flavobacteriaceae bacterium]MDA9846777.1 T9SS type B sorting domain-containing protein [Flavobacteriaceae bacterium]